MSNTIDENAYVEKILVKNNLIKPEQLEQAKAEINDEVTLLSALRDMGLISEHNSNSILKMYEKWLLTNGPAAAPAPAAPTSPAFAPRAPVPQMAPTPHPQMGQQLGRPPQPGIPQAPAMAKPAPSFKGEVSSFNDLRQYLAYGRSIGASDIHINVASPPMIRKDGKLTMLNRPAFTPEESEKLLFDAVTPEQRKALREKKGIDFCLSVPGDGRYRSCILKQRNGWDGAFRVIKSKVPSFQELGLPPQLEKLTEFHQGLVLITGPNGCGKSTTMAALLNLVNKGREEHIISIEDPVEYIFEPEKCQINQREVLTNTKSFANALRAALREDPDVIMIGELRDQETVSLAISAAETGHLVFGTLHTTSAGRTIDRILDVFPPGEQMQIRSMISESIKGIVCQQLVPRKDGNGRALAMEIMFNNAAAANLIRERKMFQLPSVMQTGRKAGMILLDDSLMKLVQDGTINGSDAYFCAENKATFVQWAPKLS